MTTTLGIATVDAQAAEQDATAQVQQALAALNAAQDAAAAADLAYGNAVRANAAVAEAKALNIALALRNPVRRVEMIAAGILTEADLVQDLPPSDSDVKQAQAMRDAAEQTVATAAQTLATAQAALSQASATLAQPLETPPTNG